MNIELIDIYLKDISLFRERILDSIVTEHDLEDELIKYQEKDGFSTYLREIRISLSKRLEKISTDKLLAFSKRPKTLKSLHIKQVYYEVLYQRKDLFIFNRNEMNQEREKIMIKQISNFSFDSFFIQMLEDPESCSLLDLQKLYKFNIGINIRDNIFSNNRLIAATLQSTMVSYFHSLSTEAFPCMT